MTASDDEFRTRHPTDWTVEALVWEYKEHDPKTDPFPGSGIQWAKKIAGAEIADRQAAFALAHHFLEHHAGAAAGQMSLEIHVHPPERDLEGTWYEISEEALEQARKLGIEDEEEVRRMARGATPIVQPNLRHGRYVMRVENDEVTWIGLAETPSRRKGR